MSLFSRHIHAARIPAAVLALSACTLWAQSTQAPTNDLPNPYETVADYFKLPAGRTWGSTSAVAVDKDGQSIWVAERCGGNSLCLQNNLDSILKFDATGKLVKSFGAGLIVSPHSIDVDRDGNIWVTDYQDNAPTPARGAAAPGAAAPAPAAPGAARGPAPAPRLGPLPGSTKGHQVWKFSPDGKVLMTLGKAGGAEGPEFFYQPTDVLVAPNGEFFVAQGHGAGANNILKFSKDGKLIKTIGKRGSGPGEFDGPHSLAMDSRGRLFVGDRSNNRVQILDQEGKFLDQWLQFSRPSGVMIDANDNIYVADSESGSVNRNRPEWRRGIRIGSAKDGKVQFLIPDPEARNAPEFTGTSAAEGIAIDAKGNLYGAEVGPRALKKYVRRAR